MAVKRPDNNIAKTIAEINKYNPAFDPERVKGKPPSAEEDIKQFSVGELKSFFAHKKGHFVWQTNPKTHKKMHVKMFNESEATAALGPLGFKKDIFDNLAKQGKRNGSLSVRGMTELALREKGVELDKLKTTKGQLWDSRILLKD